ncbi:MAG: AMP-binding protein [Acidobacteria bacterium]|nr:AMP-binding protein [Acidobacteriota bacterium]
MNFLENIFDHLRQSAERPVLQEVHPEGMVAATGREMLAEIRAARAFLLQVGLKKGDRCALLAPNSFRWAAIDLAIMAEGGIVVPLYSRQAPDELVTMMKDATPAMICCGDVSLRTNIIRAWPDAPPCHILKEIFPAAAAQDSSVIPPLPLSDNNPVAIIYTSGTSGEPKGVILTAGNLNHVLGCTTRRLDQLMGPRSEPERVFHYAPFCFAAAWILLLGGLLRHSVLTLCVDLAQVASDLRLAAPEYFTNVPIMLERMRAKIEEQISSRGGPVRRIFRSAEREWLRRARGGRSRAGGFWLALARRTVFPAIRKRLGPKLQALICGSAALVPETQQFFLMLGLPVLQVYGLTETTAICTMDSPGRIRPGWVGTAIEGVEMKLGERDEILVRGPNVFPGYWHRPEATSEALRDGWLHTGDQGEVTSDGYWRITGRIKNVIVLSSGHNVAPEPIEEKLLHSVLGAQQVVLVGNGRAFLAAIITGEVDGDRTGKALEELNSQLPHYKRVHAFHLLREPFTVENGLLTVNGKLKRDAIAKRYQGEIETIYRKHRA